MVKISSRPNSIKIIDKTFAEDGINAKLSNGPNDPIDGPTLPRLVATAPIEVISASG
jgi:hypothetical protein